MCCLLSKLLSLLCEALPVAFGVFLALYLDNRNELNKKKKYEKLIIEKISMEIQTSLSHVQEAYNKQSEVIDSISKLISLFDSKDIDKKKEGISKKIARALSNYPIRPFPTAYEPNVTLIENIDLRSKIAQYSKEINSGFEDDQYSLLLTMKIVDEVNIFVSKNIPYSINTHRIDLNEDIDIDSQEVEVLFSNLNLLGYLKLKSSLEVNRQNYHDRIISIGKEILISINDKINNNTKV